MFNRIILAASHWEQRDGWQTQWCGLGSLVGWKGKRKWQRWNTCEHFRRLQNCWVVDEKRTGVPGPNEFKTVISSWPEGTYSGRGQLPLDLRLQLWFSKKVLHTIWSYQPLSESSMYLAATEDGTVHRCSKSYAE
jgi:hypothetical protein